MHAWHFGSPSGGRGLSFGSSHARQRSSSSFASPLKTPHHVHDQPGSVIAMFNPPPASVRSAAGKAVPTWDDPPPRAPRSTQRGSTNGSSQGTVRSVAKYCGPDERRHLAFGASNCRPRAGGSESNDSLLNPNVSPRPSATNIVHRCFGHTKSSSQRLGRLRADEDIAHAPLSELCHAVRRTFEQGSDRTALGRRVAHIVSGRT